MAGASETNVDRRERLRKLALETIDLAKVSHSGGIGSQISYVCRTPTFYATTWALWNVVFA